MTIWILIIFGVAVLVGGGIVASYGARRITGDGPAHSTDGDLLVGLVFAGFLIWLFFF